MTVPIKETLRFFVSESNPEVARTRSDLGSSAQQAKLMADDFVAWLSADAGKKLPSTKTCVDCGFFESRCRGLGQRSGQRVCRYDPSEFKV